MCEHSILNKRSNGSNIGRNQDFKQKGDRHEKRNGEANPSAPSILQSGFPDSDSWKLSVCKIARAAFSCDWFLGSVNAMSEDGVFINIDGNANRIAAYAFGPKNVLLIVGMNKVVKTQEDAMSRARNEAGPINAQRFGINTPCVKNGSCFNCKSDDCICAEILVTRFSRIKNRFKIILVDEPLGF